MILLDHVNSFNRIHLRDDCIWLVVSSQFLTHLTLNCFNAEQNGLKHTWSEQRIEHESMMSGSGRSLQGRLSVVFHGIFLRNARETTIGIDVHRTETAQNIRNVVHVVKPVQ